MNNWTLHYRPFAKPPGFTVCRLVGNKHEYMRDSRTGDDAVFTHKIDAVRALRAVAKPVESETSTLLGLNHDTRLALPLR